MASDRIPLPPLDGLDPALRDRYLAGSCTAQELREVDRWIAGSPVRRSVLTAFRRALETPVVYPEFTPDSELVRRIGVAANLELAIPERAPAPSTSRSLSRRSPGKIFGREMFGSSIRRWGWSMGAMVTAALAVLFLHAGSLREFGAVRTRATTTTGQRTTMILSEGTRVTLAPKTTVQLVRFGRNERRIILNGEAYFEVSKTRDANTPFIVQTGKVSTRVLGTAFLVRHYGEDRTVRVAVTTGKVAVSSQTSRHPSVILTPGLIGTITDSTATTESMDVLQPTAWLEGRLVFHKAPTAEVLSTLSRWYDYQFRMGDSTLAAKRLTAALSASSSQDALATLKLLLKVDLRFDGKVVTLVPRAGRRTPFPARRDPSFLAPHTTEVGR